MAGVLVALAVNDWRDSRANLATERYILEGVLSDIERDRLDLERSISAAMGRFASAEALVSALSAVQAEYTHLSFPELTEVPVQESLLTQIRLKHPPGSLSATAALRLLTAPRSIQRLDVSAATFTEASASGELDRIRDIDLRAALARYYYSASLVGGTTDQRVDDQWTRLQSALANRGYPSAEAITDEDILNMLRDDRALTAEIINVRNFAIDQLRQSAGISSEVDRLAGILSAALQ